MKFLSIRVKLLLITLITLIPLIILQGFNIYENFTKRTAEKLQASVGLASAMSDSFAKYIDELWVEESIIGEHLSTINDQKETLSYLKNIVDANPSAIQRLSWISPDGTVLASTREYLIGQSITGRDYYQRIVSGEEKAVSDLVEGYVDGLPVIPISRGIRKDGKLIGLVTCSIDADKLATHIPNLKLNHGDIFKLVDSSGTIAYDSTSNYLTMAEREIPPNSPVFSALHGTPVSIAMDKSISSTSYRMSVSFPIKEINWACYLSSDRNTVLKDTYNQAIKSIITLVLVSIMSLFAAAIIGKKISDPLMVLKNKADQLKQGNYSVRTNIDGYDEIAATAEAFDHMADGIEQYDNLKSQFFSNLSHEFKTPINVIFSSAQLIESFKDTVNSEEFKNRTIRSIKGIRQNCYRLMKIVDNMIDVTRYDTGHFKMNPCKTDIVSVIENIGLSVAKYAEQKGVAIIFDTEIEEREFVCDPYMIERIVLNLISNSLKFTDPSGFIYVNIFDGRDKVIFSVKDTGIGMPEDKLSIIFDRFRQVDSSLNRNQEGSGLGLSIVKALVEAHNGNITVHSELGAGTEFIVELPDNVEYSNMKENDKALYDNHSHTIEKIEIEFSDIYSIDKN